MNFNLTHEEELLRQFKEDLGIAPSKPHCLELSLWRHGNTTNIQLECKVSIFTNNNTCVQGRGGNFGDALEKIRAALAPKSRAIPPLVAIEVTVTEPEA